MSTIPGFNGEDVDVTTFAEQPPYVYLKYFHNHECSHKHEVVQFRSYTEGGAHIHHSVYCNESKMEMLFLGIAEEDDA